MRVAIAVAFTVISLAGCSKNSTPASASQNATVTLKDGSTFSGAVAQSSTDAITLKAPDGESRTYPMSQVAGVSYEGATPAPAAPGAAPPPPGGEPPVASATSGVSPATPAPPPILTKTIAAATTIEVRTNESINSQTASAGQTYSAVVAADVPDSSGGIAIPKGSNATLIVKAASGEGKVEGQSDLVVDLDSIQVDGRQYQLDTNNVVEKGKAGVGKNKRTGLFAGGGALLGTVIGAVAGGGKGAAIGAVSGAAAGGGAQVATRGKAVRIPAETLLNFRLEAPATITEAP